MSARPKLRVIDSDLGEVAENNKLTRALAEVDRLKTDLKMAKRDVTSKNRKIAELERLKVRERMYYEHREKVEAVHSYWQRRTGSKGALTPSRFDAVRGILEQQRIMPDDGETGKQRRVAAYEYPADFKRAIDGCWHDHYVKLRKNGSEQHFMDLELICRDGSKFEEFMARAPVRA